MASTVSLERLSEEDLSRILQSMSSRAFTELSLLANFLHRESEGNPFYAVEYLRWLIESGAVEIDRRRRISGLKSELLQENKLPSSVGSLIQARLGGLDEEARNLLELAAVVGRTFGFGLLSEAAGRREAEAFHLIGPVMASGLVFETEEETYHFSHDKLRQALYEGIAGFRRRELHLRVARVLEGTEGEPAELAHHYLRAKEWWKALENLVLAAKRAEDGYAWEAAVESYSRALEIAEKLPGSEERRFELLGARERLLEHLDRREERMETVGGMFELASKDRSRLAEVHIRRIGALMSLGDLEGATEAGREAIAIFRELGNKAGEARVRQEISYVRWVSRDYPGALEANFEALRIHRQLGNRRGEAVVAGNIAQVYRGVGDHEQALRWAEKAARIHHELEDKLGEGIRLTTIAAIHRE